MMKYKGRRRKVDAFMQHLEKQFFSILGLAMRAGQIISGEEHVIKAVRGGQAKLVVMAADASENTTKKVTDKCHTYKVGLIQYGTREQLGESIGKEFRVTVALANNGFAKKLATLATQFGNEMELFGGEDFE